MKQCYHWGVPVLSSPVPGPAGVEGGVPQPGPGQGREEGYPSQALVGRRGGYPS